MADEAVDGSLFSGVVFSVLPGDTIDEHRVEVIIESIETSGGQYVPLNNRDHSIDRIDDITHVIADDVEFPQYSRCLELGISVVKATWVSTSLAKKKQANTRQHSPDPSQYFGSVVLTCADVPEGDAEAIMAGVIALGGQPSSSMTKLVTHVVTTSMDHPKCATVIQQELNVKIVLPHWFDACIKLGKKINERPYLFPDPEILRAGNNGTIRPPPTPHLVGATSASPGSGLMSSPPPSPSKSRKWLNCFMMKKLYLSEDLKIASHLQETLAGLIDYAGGSITMDADDCDFYIGQYREGPAYVAASRAGKEVANLSWLYDVLNRNKFVSPRRKLLHYPVPPNGIAGFENMKISLSNYSGDARIYIENLIRHTGAEYTKTMKQDNTHLISAQMSGEKCEAAQEWNINIVNHLWLEESFAKCTIQTISNPKYTAFPTRTNLGEVAGQTSLDMKSVERLYFPKPKSPQKLKTLERQATKANAPDSSGLATGPFVTSDIDADVPYADEEPDDMGDEATPEPINTKKPNGRPRKSTNSTTTPRLRNEDKENESPMLTSAGRVSKQKALDTLQAQAEDIALYQKEEKRVGGVVYGGRRSANPDEFVSSPAPAPRNARKRPSDEYEATGMGSDLSDGETQLRGETKNKKAKTNQSSALPEIKFRMMVTGDDRWQSNARKESADKTTLRQLGVMLTQDPSEVDMLVAPKLLRTKKFVCALAGAPLVVDTSFLDNALAKKKLAENPSLLKDREGEERLGFKLADSLKRAEQNDHKLFRGWHVHVTEGVKGGFDTYKDIVKLNGGDAYMYRGRTGITLQKRSRDGQVGGAELLKNQGEEEDFDRVYLVSSTSDAEIKQWKVFRSTVEKQGSEPRIVSPDWLLNAALRQQITFDEKWLLDEESSISQRAG